ncbi:PDZ domain-containing protein [Yeosuana sp. MJ-SS3]|uniref:PDZ domain-containing protein n=1 Tax=Gilvirhabdus luticola TaxID=3079858 RepID=A0ABU3U4H0_9FLAO|nr:PDZ domain-containing protein [Yeosuana sp. MJ-SS3]MDU8885307.1 PDZ domain-containing protein [Yeosuana sp. MJ-SS3]
MRKFLYLTFLFSFVFSFGFSQNEFSLQTKNGKDKIRFQLINNLIVIPVEVNGVELSFILDTGVSKPLIFNYLNITDSLKIRDTETILLMGLGDGDPVEALRSKNNVIKIGEAIKINQELYAIFDPSLNFAPRLGVPVHGIMGYDLFKDFVVEINYISKYITITNPEDYVYKKCRKCTDLNLEFYNNKPYVRGKVKIDDKEIPVKLLIDSGGSDALWLFEEKSEGIYANNKYFNDFLGHGLSGSVYGKRSKIDEFWLNDFRFKNANVSFPDSTSILYAKQHKERNGSVAGNILKRFNVVINYRKALITLKKNGNFRDPFSYNKSGIEIEHTGVRMVKEENNSFVSDRLVNGSGTESSTSIVIETKYKLALKPAFSIVELRKDSPAERAGLKVGDVILTINGNPTQSLELQDVVQMFYGEEGKRIKLRVDRNGIILFYQFMLESVFK